MGIQVQQVGANGPHGPLLEPTSLEVNPHELVLVAGEPGRGHTALALALAGRLRINTGVTVINGLPNNAELRRQVAIVDAPDVSAPEETLRLAAVIGEELAFAGASASKASVASWLAAHNADQYLSTRIEAIPAEVRTRLLVELAGQRSGVTTLAIVLPDRHGAGPQTWWSVACHNATEGFGVVVLCTETSARLLDVPAARIGQHDQPPSLSFAPPLAAQSEPKE